LAEYEEAEDITRVRLYLETMEDVLTATGEMTIIDESLQGILPILNLDQAAAASPEKRGPR
jgi:membrane protease subunit HflK